MKFGKPWLVAALLSLLIACGGGDNSSSSSTASNTPVVRSETLPFSSRILQDSYPLTVLLPPAYSEMTQALPVILVLDGRWHQARVADEVAAIGTAAIVVGIGNDTRREPDFVPPDFHGTLPGLGDGQADLYVAMLRDEVLPLLEQRYRIDPSQRYLMGHSLGGLLVEYALLNDNPNEPTYRGYFASDASNFNVDYLDQLEQRLYQESSRLPVKLFVGSATAGNNTLAQHVGRAMESHHYPELQLTIRSYQTDHNAIMALAVPDAMSFFFASAAGSSTP